MIVYKKYFQHFDDSFDFEIHRLLKNNIESGFILFTEPSSEEFKSIHFTSKFQLQGAVFPGLVFDSKVYLTGAILICFEFPVTAKLMSSIELSKMTVHELKSQFQEFSETTSLMVMADSKNQNIEKTLSLMYDFLGPDVQIFGSYIECNDRCRNIFYFEDQWSKDDLLLVSLESAKSRQESFGWIKDCGPFLITEKSDFKIHTLDYEPALNFYKEAMGAKTLSVELMNSQFLYCSHPLGLEHINGSMTVCQVNPTDDHKLTTSIDLHQNTFVYILKYDHQAFLQSTEKMIQRLLKDRRTLQSYDLFVFYSKDRLEVSKVMNGNELQSLSVLGENYGGLCFGVFKNKLNGSFEMQPLSFQCNSIERKDHEKSS